MGMRIRSAINPGSICNKKMVDLDEVLCASATLQRECRILRVGTSENYIVSEKFTGFFGKNGLRGIESTNSDKWASGWGDNRPRQFPDEFLGDHLIFLSGDFPASRMGLRTRSNMNTGRRKNQQNSSHHP